MAVPVWYKVWYKVRMAESAAKASALMRKYPDFTGFFGITDAAIAGGIHERDGFQTEKLKGYLK